MSIALYTLLMFGCADDGTACQRIAYDTPAYSAAAQCQAQVEPALSSDTALREAAQSSRCQTARRADFGGSISSPPPPRWFRFVAAAKFFVEPPPAEPYSLSLD